MKLSILIPAYNEEKRILPTLEKYYSFFKEKLGKDFEIFVIINGCTDDTFGVVKKFGKAKYVDIGKVNDKGEAVIKGFELAGADYIGYTDADGSTPAESFYDLYDKIGKNDGIIASRWSKGSIVSPKQPLSRRIASRCFNLMVRVLFSLHLNDTQCGAKLFKRDPVKSVLKDITTTRWAFDVDLLYQLRRKGYSIIDIPTVWHDDVDSVLNLKKASGEMFLSLIRLRLLFSPFKFIVKFYDWFMIKVMKK